jgi:predicted MFS family arabinose efflux permease
MGLTLEQLPAIYLITGVCSFIIGPLAGKLSDKVGKYKMFIIGSIASMICVTIYTNLGITPLWLIAIINVLLFSSITARMIPASALMTAVPTPKERGAYMSVNSAAMQIAGGLASVLAGQIVGQTANGMILNYNTLGYVVVGTMTVMVAMMYFINRDVTPQAVPSASAPEVIEEIVMTEA